MTGTCRRKIHWGKMFALLAAVPVAWLGWTILQNHCDPQGEPFSLNEGISIWPSEIVSAFAVILSIVFLLKAHLDLLKSKKKLHDDCSLHDAATSDEVKEA